MATDTIKVGDVIQRVSTHIIDELRVLLGNMKSLTPELRTVKLRALVSRSKKQLADLLAICKWLESPDVGKYFNSLNQMHFQITNTENELNEIQDGLYFTHRDLFAKRIRPINVRMARDILALGHYAHLPVPIFTCGRMPAPRLPSEIKVRENLEIFIRAKLFLVDTMPRYCFQLRTTIQNGALHIVVPNMYELVLTLQYADESAPWNIIGFNFLVSSSLSENSENEPINFDVVSFEAGVLQKLRDMVGNKVAIERIFATDNRTQLCPQKSSGTTVSNAPAIDSILNLGDVSTVDETCHPSGESIEKEVSLQRILGICNHAAEAIQLRVLYAQGLQLKRAGIWNGDNIELSYSELDRCTAFIMKIWKSTQSGYGYAHQL